MDLKHAYHNSIIIVRYTSVHAIIALSPELNKTVRSLRLKSGWERNHVSTEKQRIDLRLNEDDKHMIEEAAAMTNQSISQFMVSTASERAAEVIDQHRRLLLNEESWNLVMDAIINPPAPNDRLKRAANRLQELE